jgi:hypothetical protein
VWGRKTRRRQSSDGSQGRAREVVACVRLRQAAVRVSRKEGGGREERTNPPEEEEEGGGESQRARAPPSAGPAEREPERWLARRGNCFFL